MRRICFLFLVLFYSNQSIHAQNAYTDSLLHVISSLQVKEADPYYNAGLFPSQRCYLAGRYSEKEDDNIFFTGLVVWTLKSIRPELTPANRERVDRIAAHAIKNYPLYANKDGRPTFNFWQTNPSRHFPNSQYFSKRKRFIIPDDLDDTAILYLSADYPDSLKQIVKQLMAENANGNKYTIRNTYRHYKHRKAYSTWLGKKMPVDFDICVQANGLRFVLDNNFQLNTYDSASIQLIKDMVLSGRYLKRPAYASPHYQSEAAILYHLTRLVAAHPQQSELNALRPQLSKDIKNQMTKTVNGMQLTLLQTSLMRLEDTILQRVSISEKDIDSFYFFVANMTSTFPNPVKGTFVKSRKTNFFYKCRAYYLTILLEHELYRLSKNPVVTQEAAATESNTI